MPTLKDIIAAAIIDALNRHDGIKTRAARELKIPYRTFTKKISSLQKDGYQIPPKPVTKRELKAFRKKKIDEGKIVGWRYTYCNRCGKRVKLYRDGYCCIPCLMNANATKK